MPIQEAVLHIVLINHYPIYTRVYKNNKMYLNQKNQFSMPIAVKECRKTIAYRTFKIAKDSKTNRQTNLFDRTKKLKCKTHCQNIKTMNLMVKAFLENRVRANYQETIKL